MMVKKLKDLLQSNRYQILYYFYRKKKVKTYPGIKSKFKKAFGYKSDGHFYPDWDYLFDEGFLIEKKGHIQITKKGRKEFSLLYTIQLAEIVSVILGIIFFYFWFLEILGIPMYPWVFPAYGILMFATSVFYHIILKNFEPEIPKVDEL